MAKIDKVKEQVGWLKVVFGLLVAITTSLIGWLFLHYEENQLVTNL